MGPHWYRVETRACRHHSYHGARALSPGTVTQVKSFGDPDISRHLRLLCLVWCGDILGLFFTFTYQEWLLIIVKVLPLFSLNLVRGSGELVTLDSCPRRTRGSGGLATQEDSLLRRTRVRGIRAQEDSYLRRTRGSRGPVVQEDSCPRRTRDSEGLVVQEDS